MRMLHDELMTMMMLMIVI